MDRATGPRALREDDANDLFAALCKAMVCPDVNSLASLGAAVGVVVVSSVRVVPSTVATHGA